MAAFLKRLRQPISSCGIRHDTSQILVGVVQVKHLDIDALDCQHRLYKAEISSKWKKGAIHCTSGTFPPNREEDWRLWRNSLPDAKLFGEE